MKDLCRKLFPAAGFVAAFTGFYILAQSQTATLPKLKSSDPLPSGLFVDLYKAVNPAVVNIFTTYMPRGRRLGPMGNDPYRDPFFELFQQFSGPQHFGRAAPQQSLGSGFIIRDDGLIITNNHVVDQADIIKVQLEERTKESFDAKIVGKDARTDVALIKIDTKKKLPFVKLGSSGETQVGEWVAAFGNPYGYGHTMTKGIVSAIGREIDDLNLNPFMQTDASINPGNSGGPLVNTQGLAIGVNTAIDQRAQGIGFVIPIDSIKTLLPALEKDGGIKRGFLGVTLADIDEEGAKTLGIHQTEGALIVQVVPNTAADRAGLEPYDLVTEFDGKKVATSGELRKFVAMAAVGKSVPVKIIRNGKPKSLSVSVAPISEPTVAKNWSKGGGEEGDAGSGGGGPGLGIKAPFNLGFAASDYSNALADQYHIAKLRKPHPIVVAIQSEGEAAKAGIAPGDIILDVNRHEVTKAKEVMQYLRKGSINILRILKQDRTVLVAIRVR